MNNVNAIAILCEDVRQEVGGQFTVVGTLSDNLVVPHVPSMLPKLAVFVRITMPVDSKAEHIAVHLCSENARNLIGEFEKDFVATTLAEAKALGNPLAGLILTAVASPYRLDTLGVHWVEFNYGTETSTIGALRFFQPETPSG